MKNINKVSFARDVRPLFQSVDIEHMKGMDILLDDYKYRAARLPVTPLREILRCRKCSGRVFSSLVTLRPNLKGLAQSTRESTPMIH